MDQALNWRRWFPNNTPFIRKKASKKCWNSSMSILCLLVNFPENMCSREPFESPNGILSKFRGPQMLSQAAQWKRGEAHHCRGPRRAIYGLLTTKNPRDFHEIFVWQSFSWMIYGDSWNQNKGCETLNGCVSKISDHSTCSWKHWIFREGFCVKFWGIWAYPKSSWIHHVIKIFFNFQQSRWITGKGCKFQVR